MKSKEKKGTQFHGGRKTTKKKNADCCVDKQHCGTCDAKAGCSSCGAE